ncbi:hypothetical protein FDG09_02235 [Clostridium sporogenes]|uniref:hypothetical protein n=1 Tax=Clostridium sporogenes TaxID=1509 RepID=UPI0013D76145|nr:hypothetical protein [Clostridium sporogenes]NFV11767.1 hypothetical protein [Clostridium sporogenes]
MDRLFEWGAIKSGDDVVIKNRDNSEATVIDSKYVDFKGEKLTFNKWGKSIMSRMYFENCAHLLIDKFELNNNKCYN